uniref:Beta-defensin-like domain-containing protein n=1 Tax=Sus scrofa TaxID=9823 RepID=A0A4X1TQ13_PIG
MLFLSGSTNREQTTGPGREWNKRPRTCHAQRPQASTMLTPLPFICPSPMTLHGLLSILLLLTLFSPVKSGLASAEYHCVNLGGICRRDLCNTLEDQLGACKRRWKCCRAWWILLPVPTPIIYSDYQEPIKHKVK